VAGDVELLDLAVARYTRSASVRTGRGGSLAVHSRASVRRGRGRRASPSIHTPSGRPRSASANVTSVNTTPDPVSSVAASGTVPASNNAALVNSSTASDPAPSGGTASTTSADPPEPHVAGFWAVDAERLTGVFSEIYHLTVTWKRNLFIIPFGSEGGEFVSEVAFLISKFTDCPTDMPYAWYAVMVACALLLQRSHASPSTTDNKKYLARRLKLWRSGDIKSLLDEAMCIQAHLPPRVPGERADDLDDRVFANMAFNGKIGSAAQYLAAGGKGGVMQADEAIDAERTVLDVLKEKHPEPREADESCLLDGEFAPPNPVLYEALTPAVIIKMARQLSGSAGPSGLDAVAWRRMLTGFKGASNNLASALAGFAKCLCTMDLSHRALIPFLAGRLIPLNKNPGVRPISVGEVLRRIVGKAIMSVIERDVLSAVAPWQLCVGLPSACEVAVRVLSHLYESDLVDGILLVDASNAFNAMNREVAKHNIPRVCPAAGRVFLNTYNGEIPLFLANGDVVGSREGTCQGDPLAMAFYALAMAPLDCVARQTSAS